MKINQIPVSIATDGFVTSGTFSVLSEAQKCYLFHNKNSAGDPKISAQEIFDMITINPAKALGVLEKVGSIEAGKKADIIFFKHTSLSVAQPVRTDGAAFSIPNTCSKPARSLQ